MKVVLGLGCNLGDRLSSLRSAVRLLRSDLTSFKVISISPIYESDALLLPNSPPEWNIPHLNLAVLAETNLNPSELLLKIKSIEKVLGRRSRDRWAPREMDIDILAMDLLVLKNENLTIPHLRLMERPFAVLPFSDLLPDWIHPDQSAYEKKTIKEWALQWRFEKSDSSSLHIRRTSFHLAEVISILNITPDSSSDGGMFFSPIEAIKHVHELRAFGLQILELGAESTRPGADWVSPEDEWRRLEPVFSDLKTVLAESSVRISIDTRHSKTARKAVEMGVHWLNDVDGFENLEMQEIAINSKIDIVAMHSLGVPADRKRVLSVELDPVLFLFEWGTKKIEQLVQSGISKDRIILDPGIGFGKTAEQSWAILRDIAFFQNWGVRILVGHSRKSFLSRLDGSETPSSYHLRDPQTATLSSYLAANGVDYLRVHQLDMNLAALRAWTQIDGVIQCRRATGRSFSN